MAVADAKPVSMPAAPVVAAAPVAKPTPVAVARPPAEPRRSVQVAVALPVPPRFVPPPAVEPTVQIAAAAPAPMPSVIHPAEDETTVTILPTAAILPRQSAVTDNHVVKVAAPAEASATDTAPEVPLAGSATPPTEAERAAAEAKRPEPAAVATAPVVAPPAPAPVPAAAKPVKLASAVPAAPPPRRKAQPQSDSDRHMLDIQLGAFDSEQAARAEWQRLKARMPALLTERTPRFLKVERDGATIWRLRTSGFAGQDQARGFCAKLQSATSRCWVVGS